ncbi:hypothetical protein [Actinomyces faecalis]|uniref:hypothetical protein n=1 Tax=Actinomyces faecalis TaxID=2722820 RepID=UPI00155747D8|nr:hypothetical protein [Actinomyces faecalis]
MRTFTLTIGTRAWHVPMEQWWAVHDQIDTIWHHGHETLRFPCRGKDTRVFIDRSTPVTMHG